MKNLVLIVGLWLAVGSAAYAQQPMPAASSTSTLGGAAARPLADSVQRVVHQLFKLGRTYGLISTISGGLVLGSGTGYAIGGDRSWSTGISIAMGGTGVWLGVTSLVRFNRRHEQQVLAALERGESMPQYVMLMMPFVRMSMK